MRDETGRGIPGPSVAFRLSPGPPLIVPATQADATWLRAVYNAERAVLWDFDPTWFRYWKANNPRARWVVVREFAFAHYLIKRDGSRTLYEIAVTVPARRKGIGRALLEHVGHPVNLKTDADNAVANAFYRSLGLLLTGQTNSRDGNRKLNVYQG